MKNDCIILFAEACRSVMKSAANMDITIGEQYVKTSPFASNTIAVIIGITGDIKGQVIFSMSVDVACDIASSMMLGMQVNELDELSKSAVTEAANMILGNAATLLYNKGIKIDITPPTLLTGENMQVSTINKMETRCIPLNISTGGKMELDIAFAQ